ncbi:LysR substrate-binding domain-containing protein [Shimia sp.]|uniref:LysR substrate-binding domain-containing protein n=1 Tax=Shimia sp. TaxID=1954381 RepID=UPI003296C1E4
MRYSQIKAFHHVALHGGFSRAAEALNQSQPSLSEQVRNLEQAHDVLLFRRDHRQVRLTEAGEQLFLLTRQYFEDEERIGDFLSRSKSHIDGTLRIVADSAIHITQALQKFRRANPHAVVSIQSGNTEEVLQKLRNYEAEVGVVGNHEPAQDLDELDLGRTSIMAIGSKDILPKSTEGIAFEDLRDWPLIFREQGSRTRSGLERMAVERRINLHPTIEVDGREAMREVVASGAGIGFVSEAEMGFDKRLRAVPILGSSMTMSESLVYLSMRKDLQIIRAFLRCFSKPD